MCNTKAAREWKTTREKAYCYLFGPKNMNNTLYRQFKNVSKTTTHIRITR